METQVETQMGFLRFFWDVLRVLGSSGVVIRVLGGSMWVEVVQGWLK